MEAPEEGGKAEEGGAWDLDVDLGEINVDEGPAAGGKGSEKGYAVLPSAGPSARQLWTGSSLLAADHIAAGAFDSAMKLLNQQAGIVNFAPLEPLFLAIYTGAQARYILLLAFFLVLLADMLFLLSLPTLASAPSQTMHLQRPLPQEASGLRGGLPRLALSFQVLADERLKAGYRAFTSGKFQEALGLFHAILTSLALVVVDTKKEAGEVKELLGICREYILGLKIELQRKEAQDPVRQTELGTRV